MYPLSMYFNRMEIIHIALRVVTSGHFRLIGIEFDDPDGLTSNLYADENERDTIDSTIEVGSP